MAKRRIFQIAKELNISHTEILSFLEGKGINVASHMAPIDEDIYKIVLSEFHKDKESVERYRKEQVRREIHDTRLLEQQKANKKLNLLSLEKQRELEEKEKKKEQEDTKAKEAAQDCIQLHGGMGVANEMSIGHFFKKLTFLSMLFGDSDYHYKRYELADKI